MKERVGNIWSCHKADVICITTNGDIKKNGGAVMGAGIAYQATLWCEDIEYGLAEHLNKNGNIPGIIGEVGIEINDEIVNRIKLVSFPTKHSWKKNSDINLIENSAKLLVEMTDLHEWNDVCIPRPGCNNGKLDWIIQVKPILEKILDNRFTIFNNEKKLKK